MINLKFCQVVFHTLFFTDFYLGSGVEDLKQQPFHRDHPDFFRDYEELEDRRQVLLYDRPTTRQYLEHCRRKAAAKIEASTAETLEAPCGFQPRTFSRAELHVYNIRHIQDHAGQLSLRLRIDTGCDGTSWVGSGWREL